MAFFSFLFILFVFMAIVKNVNKKLNNPEDTSLDSMDRADGDVKDNEDADGFPPIEPSEPYQRRYEEAKNPDPVFEEELITAEKDFWENYVLKNDPPAFTEKPELCFETIDRYVQVQISKKAMTLTGFDEVLPTIAELKEKKKALEDASKAVQEQIDTLILPIIDSMGTQTAATATVNGIQYDISYKPMDRTSINKDNLKRLQIGHPDVYDEYVTTTTSRRLTFKSKTV